VQITNVATAVDSRNWRAAHPENSRAAASNYRKRNPLTPEQLAHKAAVNKAWRLRNAEYLKREYRKRMATRRDEINARRRANYPKRAEADRARNRAWKAANPDHNRRYYRDNREKFTGDGKYAKRVRKTRRALRLFAATLAAGRAALATS
jgi:hypothetical protein